MTKLVAIRTPTHDGCGYTLRNYFVAEDDDDVAIAKVIAATVPHPPNVQIGVVPGKEANAVTNLRPGEVREARLGPEAAQ